jgi:hypothetical protein
MNGLELPHPYRHCQLQPGSQALAIGAVSPPAVPLASGLSAPGFIHRAMESGPRTSRLALLPQLT